MWLSNGGEVRYERCVQLDFDLTTQTASYSERVAQKIALRRDMRQRRRHIAPSVHQDAAYQLVRHARYWLRPKRRLAAYLACGSELDLRPLMLAAIARRCRVFVPVIPKRGRKMSWVEWRPDMRMRRNRLGILEPIGARVSARYFQRVFVPLLAFDAAGYRLGQGGGYYDTTFAARRWRRLPYWVGVGFACQEVADVPHDPWDQRLDVVLTEQGVRRLTRER